MHTQSPAHRHHARIALSALALLIPCLGHAQVTQTVTSTAATSDWNSAIWGSPAQAAAGGNAYITSASATPALSGNGANTRLNYTISSRVRAYGAVNSSSPVFNGASLTIVPQTELLLKDNNETYVANFILNGGVLRFSPDSAGSATVGGTISVLSSSILGVAQSGGSTLVVSSILTGAGSLRLAGGLNSSVTLSFDDGVGTSLNGFSGTFDIGGGSSSVIVDFNQPYNLSLANMTMGNYSTADVLSLDANIVVNSFSFAGNQLTAGVAYTATELNALFGTGTQFIGTGTLTAAVPEPASVCLLLGGLGAVLVIAARRRQAAP